MTPDFTPQEIPHIDLRGTVVGGFRLDEQLSGDAHSAVYRARKLLESGEYAVKIVLAGFTSDSTFARQFKAYTDTLSKLEHPNVAAVYSAGTFEYGYFLVTAFIAGETLAQRLTRGRLSPPEIQAIVGDVAAGLDALHRMGIAHGNLKPSNIIITPEGTAKLVDFGVAHLPTANGYAALQQTAAFPYYVAPEMLTGENPAPPADIYALGALLFEMIAGSPPFVDVSPLGVWQKHLHTPVPNIQDFAPDAPSTVRALLEQSLAKDPADRFNSASALAETLARVWHDSESVEAPVTATDGTVILPPIFSGGEKDGQFQHRHFLRRRWLIGATALVLVLTALVWGMKIGAFATRPIAAATATATETHVPSPTPFPTATPLPVATATPAPLLPTATPVATVATAIPPTPTVAPTATAVAPTPTLSAAEALAELHGKILFKTNRDGDVEIFQMDADGSNQQPLPPDRAFLYNEAVRWEAFSADHRQTAVVRGEGQFDLWWVNLADGMEKRLTGDPAADYDPAWSPVDDRIAFVSERTGNGDLYLLNLADGAVTRLTDDANAFDKHPSWSPDGDALAFWSNRGGQNRRQIWRFNITTRQMVNLSQNSFDDWDPVWVK